MPEAESDSRAKKRRRRKRFLLRLLVILAVLALMVWSLPYVISTDFGTRIALRIASSRLRGNIEADDLSLTWRGPTRIRGLHVTDAQGRRVMTADEVKVSAGVWGLMRDAERFGEVDLHTPRAELYAERDRPVSLIRAFRPTAEPSEPSAPARPRGTVRMHNGSVRIVEPDGTSRRFEDISLLMRLDTLDDVEAHAEMSLAGGRIVADARFRGLVRDGSFQPLGAEAQGQVRTDAPVDLAALAREYGLYLQAEPAGLANLDGSFTLADGKGSAELTLSVDALAAGASRVGEIRPIDVTVESQASWTPGRINGQLNLRRPGTLDLTFETDTSTPPQSDFTEAMLAVLSGRPAGLGEFRATLDGQVDLAEIAAAVPALLKLRPDVEITAGSILFEDCQLTGGDWPETSGHVRIDAMVAGRRDFRGGPVDLRWRGVSRQDSGPDVSVKLDSPFALASAATTEEGVRGELTRLDLDELRNRLSGVFDLGDLSLAGRLSGELAVDIDKRPNAEDLDELSFTGRLAGEDVLIVRDGRRFEVQSLDTDYTGTLSATHHDKPVLRLSSFSLEADDAMSISGPVSVDFRDGSWSAGPDLTAQAELPWLLNRMVDMRIVDEPPKISAGRVDWTGSADSSQGVLSADGEGKLAELRFADAQYPATEGPIAFTHRAELLDDGDTLRISQLHVTADELSMKLSGSVEELTGRAVADIAGDYAGDWQRITGIIHRLAPATRGQLLIRGPAEGSFVLRGPLRGEKDRVATAELDAESGVGWSSMDAWGLDLLEGKLTLTMSDAVARVQGEPIPTAGDGRVRLPLEIDLRGDAPVLRLREPADVVESAQVTEQAGKELISRFNPVFADLGAMDGLLTLHLDDLELPLSEPAIRTGTGRGRLDMSRLNVRPAGMLSQLLTLLGQSADRQRSMSVGTVNFTIADGAVHYDDFTVRFGDDLDLNFRGSVGFDDTVDLAVSVPLRAELLRRLGVAARFVDYARVLEGMRVEIPVVGTRLRPRLDLSDVDLTEPLRRATELLLLERLRGGRDDGDDDDTDDESADQPRRDAPSQLPRTDPQPRDTPRRSDPLLDILWDALEQPDRKAENSDRETEE